MSSTRAAPRSQLAVRACKGMTSRIISGGPRDAKSDQLKGQAKEAAGTLTGNKDLKSEGKADRRAGEAKDRVGHAREKIEEMIDDVKAKGKDVVDKAKDALHRK